MSCRVDQGDEQFLDSMAREPVPFDIIIDDGSHMSHHVIASFNALFPTRAPWWHLRHRGSRTS